MSGEGSFLGFLVKLTAVNLLRYFLVAGPAFLLFYIVFKEKWQLKRIQSRFPASADYYREIGYSLVTIAIFVVVALVIFATPLVKFTLVYQDISERGWGWWWFSIVLMIFLHDTYFYWTHRAMHHPSLFKYFHLVHHKSTNPSPWAAYAFHPLEAVVEASIIFPIVFLIPSHATAILTFLLFMIVYNVYGHLGYELYPKRFSSHPIGKWLNTSVNHNMHHKHFTGNYGLYFLFWDRWLNTIHPDYDKRYAEVDEKRANAVLKVEVD